MSDMRLAPPPQLAAGMSSCVRAEPGGRGRWEGCWPASGVHWRGGVSVWVHPSTSCRELKETVSYGACFRLTAYQ